MSSNGRITRSKGPADGVSLPPITRPKKGTNTEAETEKSMATQHQVDRQGDQLGNTFEQASPFTRPGSRAGASTVPANTTEVPRHLATHLCGQAARLPGWISTARLC